MVNLLLSFAVLAITYLSIKILNKLLDRFLKYHSEEQESPEQDDEKQFFDKNIILSFKAFLKTLIFYGGYFMALIIILEIFHVRIISAEDLKSIGVKIIKVIGIVVGAKLVRSLGRMVINHFFEQKHLHHNLLDNRRAETLKALLKSVLTYLIFFMAGIMILQVFNVNTSAILASAGILGLAVGFGAQNLVKDVISGFFIIFEDQFTVGDYVQTAGIVGVVEEVGLRTSKIREWTGQLHIIPNGQITQVTNFNRGPMVAVVIVNIAYEEDIDQAIEVLRQECEEAYNEEQAIIEVPTVQGVVALSSSSVDIRVTATTLAGEQWAVERKLLRRFKYALDRAGIEIPYPRMVLEEKQNSGKKTVLPE